MYLYIENKIHSVRLKGERNIRDEKLPHRSKEKTWSQIKDKCLYFQFLGVVRSGKCSIISRNGEITLSA